MLCGPNKDKDCIFGVYVGMNKGIRFRDAALGISVEGRGLGFLELQDSKNQSEVGTTSVEPAGRSLRIFQPTQLPLAVNHGPFMGR